MESLIVIANASAGEPLVRTVMSRGRRHIYLANPERIDSIRSGETDPVGFPAEDVYAFDSEILDQLRAEWNRAGQTDPDTWSRLMPFDLAAASAKSAIPTGPACGSAPS